MGNAVIGALRVVLGIDTAQFEQGLKGAQRQLEQTGRKFQQLGQSLTDIGTRLSIGLTAPFAAFTVAVAKGAGDFEKAMKRVEAALDGIDPKTLKQLSDMARELGPKLGFSATTAAEAIENLAKNGLDASQIIGGAFAASLKLAAAGNAELGPAADLTTDIMNQFGRKASDLGPIVDKVTGALLASKFGFDDYRLALGQAGGVAGGLGISFEDFNTAIAATSALFASGSDAGTSFKTFLQRLVPQSKEAGNVMKQLGLSFFTAKGEMKPLSDVAEQLRTALGKLSDEGRSKALTAVFGADAMRTAIGLAKEGAAGFDRLRTSISAASADKQVQKNQEGLAAALERMKAAFLNLEIAIGNSGLLDFLTRFIDAIAGILKSAAEVSPTLVKVGFVIGGLAATIGPIILIMGQLATAIGSIRLAIAGLSVALAEGGILAGVGAALSGALLPIAGIIAAVVAAVALFKAASGSAAGDVASLGTASTVTADAIKKLNGESLADPTAKLAGAAGEMARQRAAQAKATFEAAQAEAAFRAAAAGNRLADLADGKVTEKNSRGMPVERTLSTAFNRGKQGSELSLARWEAQDQLRQAQADFKAVGDAYEAAKKRMAAPAAAPKPTGNVTTQTDKTPKAPKGRVGQRTSDDLRVQAQIEAARERGDEATAQRLQDQLDLQRQIEAYERTGLTTIAAKAAASRDLADIQAARTASAAKELSEQRASIDVETARLTGNTALEGSLQRQADLRQRIERYYSLTKDLAQATALAEADQAKLDEARAKVRARWIMDDAQDRKLRLAQLRGDTREAEQLQRGIDRRDRARTLQSDAGLSADDANRQAGVEIDNEARAKLQGDVKGFFSDGVRAAMDGDLKSFAKDWIRDWSAKGMEEALNSLSKLIATLFSKLAAGSGGGGGGFLSTLGKALGLVKGVPALAGNYDFTPAAIPKLDLPSFAGSFATGGSFKVGGRGGIDRNLVSMRLSRGERVDITPANDRGGDDQRGGDTYHFSGNLMTPEFWERIQTGDDNAAVRGANGGDALARANLDRCRKRTMR